jgi:hypothetical protein
METITIPETVWSTALSILGSLKASATAWFQRSKILTSGLESYSNYITRNVGVFSLFGTQREIAVEAAYIGVAISSDSSLRYRSAHEIEKSLLLQHEGKVDYAIANSPTLRPLAALESTKVGFALVGHAGSGKTTAFKHIAVKVAQGYEVHGRKRIPIYLAVRDMAVRRKGLLAAISELFDLWGVTEIARVLASLLRSGNLLLLMDGLDETDPSHQRELLSELIKLKAKYPNVVTCISSRPHSLSIDLPGFQKWETLPLTFHDRLNLVEKWFAAVDPGKGRRLLERCHSEREILDLGSNPLLLSIICALFHNDLQLPSDREELYSRAVEGLLGGWDAFRNIARTSVLADLSVGRRVLLASWLSYDLLRAGKRVFTYRDVLRQGTLEKAATSLRWTIVSPDELLAALCNDFGILVQRAPGLYTFTHLTLQEYLCARFVVDRREEDRLFKHSLVNDEGWLEVVKLIAKMLPNADDFMAKITNLIRVHSRYEALLISECWKMYPICSREAKRMMMSRLAMMIDTSLNFYRPKFSVEKDVLLISLSQEGFSLYDTIPLLVQVVVDSGIPIRELEYRARSSVFSAIESADQAVTRVKVFMPGSLSS